MKSAIFNRIIPHISHLSFSFFSAHHLACLLLIFLLPLLASNWLSFLHFFPFFLLLSVFPPQPPLSSTCLVSLYLICASEQEKWSPFTLLVVHHHCWSTPVSLDWGVFIEQNRTEHGRREEKRTEQDRNG